ncbi:hypothetical protein BJ508DRAFT_326793 [Ascobolus immersus RN42]|uniref:Uncharacterized protein n=1 Tax=Ascobolus immersus RN42 TaxID=1160509 RepID=A0A3N4I4B7_ASCIM|nr:hypothetical protein BJ508DRAFT_326793 [Ascobolus immersus RN42]
MDGSNTHSDEEPPLPQVEDDTARSIVSTPTPDRNPRDDPLLPDSVFSDPEGTDYKLFPIGLASWRCLGHFMEIRCLIVNANASYPLPHIEMTGHLSVYDELIERYHTYFFWAENIGALHTINANYPMSLDYRLRESKYDNERKIVLDCSDKMEGMLDSVQNILQNLKRNALTEKKDVQEECEESPETLPTSPEELFLSETEYSKEELEALAAYKAGTLEFSDDEEMTASDLGPDEEYESEEDEIPPNSEELDPNGLVELEKGLRSIIEELHALQPRIPRPLNLIFR